VGFGGGEREGGRERERERESGRQAREARDEVRREREAEIRAGQLPPDFEDLCRLCDGRDPANRARVDQWLLQKDHPSSSGPAGPARPGPAHEESP
jgi:hypothetical protein